MLFYIKCPSCSRFISGNLDKYLAELQTIRDDPQKNKKQKEMEGSKLLEKYDFNEPCCRIRILGQIPYHEIILT
uniref:Uncharacterized protein n=1 Tax=viral metagenome TaxID=1070528 RepID=A0A6C0LTY8_9ZZZZ